MAKVTEKSTKAQILDEVVRLQKELEAARTGSKTVAQVQEEKVTVTRKESAKEVIGMNILNETITKQYEDVMFSIEIAKKELAEIEEVKEAIIDAEAVIMAKDALIAQRESKELVKLAELKEEAESIITYRKTQTEALEHEYKEKLAYIKKERERELEEFKYNQKRERQIENDKWADEKAAREKELAEREEANQIRTDELNETQLNYRELEAKVAEIPTLITEAKENGQAEAKKAYDREKAIEVNAVKKNAEWEIKMANMEKDRAIEESKKANEKIAILEAKLEAAYTSMNTLATTTVQSTGGVKVLGLDKDK